MNVYTSFLDLPYIELNFETTPLFRPTFDRPIYGIIIEVLLHLFCFDLLK